MMIIMKRGFRSEPCTIQCVRAMGTIPQLQCKKCLCLYHHECVGLGSSTSIVESYVCQVCPNGIDNFCIKKFELNLFFDFQGCRPPEMLPIATPPIPPPPPAPIPPALIENSSIPNDSNCASSSTSQQSVPKIERDHKPFTHHHHNINRGGNSLNSTKENVVDSLTTWHYNTANISTNRNNLNKFDTPPQSIASINGRKFIIVPKTNVLSVSPSSEMKSHNQDDTCERHSPPAGTHPDNGGIYGSGNGGGGNGGVIGNGDYNM